MPRSATSHASGSGDLAQATATGGDSTRPLSDENETSRRSGTSANATHSAPKSQKERSTASTNVERSNALAAAGEATRTQRPRAAASAGSSQGRPGVRGIS